MNKQKIKKNSNNDKVLKLFFKINSFFLDLKFGYVRYY